MEPSFFAQTLSSLTDQLLWRTGNLNLYVCGNHPDPALVRRELEEIKRVVDDVDAFLSRQGKNGK